jgi:lipase chaperone LimK
VDTESVALASTAAATLVTLLTTDAWTQVKKEIAALWRRFRSAHAAAVEADLNAAREEALAAAEIGNETVVGALTAEWEARLRRLLAADPAAVAEIARVITVLKQDTANPAQYENVTITQKADASDCSTVIQIGGDGRFG